MLKAVLLDLDNTLILFDELTYYKAYFKKLHTFFKGEFTMEELQERLVSGTMELRRNNGSRSNRQHFMETFTRGMDVDLSGLWDRFMAFYREAYDDMGVTVSRPAGLHAGLERLRRSGLKLVIASNPIFPVIAQEKRARWGNLDPGWFILFTHMENMRYVKPMPEYFLQACELIGEEPETCLMVGNDPVNDMSAAQAGLKTYRTTDAEVIDYASLTLTDEQRKGSPQHIPEPDYQGPFAGVADIVEQLTVKNQ